MGVLKTKYGFFGNIIIYDARIYLYRTCLCFHLIQLHIAKAVEQLKYCLLLFFGLHFILIIFTEAFCDKFELMIKIIRRWGRGGGDMCM